MGLLWRSLSFFTCVCAMTRTTEQYFLMRSSSRSTSFSPPSAAEYLAAYFVMALRFDLYQFL